MIYKHRTFVIYDNGQNTRITAKCPFCHTENYVLITNEWNILDFCEHNHNPMLIRGWFRFANVLLKAGRPT